MALRLEIISAHREELGNRARIVVGESGCTIGRALDNDWALPDQLRFLSGHHASIHFRGGDQEGRKLGRKVGAQAYALSRAYIDGRAGQ